MRRERAPLPLAGRAPPAGAWRVGRTPHRRARTPKGCLPSGRRALRSASLRSGRRWRVANSRDRADTGVRGPRTAPPPATPRLPPSRSRVAPRRLLPLPSFSPGSLELPPRGGWWPRRRRHLNCRCGTAPALLPPLCHRFRHFLTARRTDLGETSCRTAGPRAADWLRAASTPVPSVQQGAAAARHARRTHQDKSSATQGGFLLVRDGRRAG